MVVRYFENDLWKLSVEARDCGRFVSIVWDKACEMEHGRKEFESLTEALADNLERLAELNGFSIGPTFRVLQGGLS